jgi:hypothetical protein
MKSLLPFLSLQLASRYFEEWDANLDMQVLAQRYSFVALDLDHFPQHEQSHPEGGRYCVASH